VNRTRLALAAIPIAAFGLLGCTSNPSAKAVAKDMVQSITVPGGSLLPQGQQECMLSVIDKMSEDQVKKLGADNLNAVITPEGGGDPAMDAFIKELQSCEGATGAPTTSTPEDGSTPSDGTDATTTTRSGTTTTTTG
jgi:hypothetical protein